MRFLTRRHCLLALVALFVSISASAAPTTLSILNGGQKLVRNADGTIDGAYPNGDKGSGGAVLACSNFASFPSLTGLITGQATSISLPTYFTGSGVGSAVYSVTATGTNANKWIVSGNNLTHDGTVTGSGSITIRGASAGNPIDCPTVSWSYQAPPSTDTKAPSPVTGFRQTGNATSAITFTYRASSDPCTSTPCTGVDHYDIKRGATTVATQPASLGLQSSLTSLNVGTVAGTNTGTPNGTSWTLQGTSAGIEGTADQAALYATNLSGTYTSISACAASVSNAGSNTYHKGFIEFRGSNAVDAAAVDAVFLNSNGVTYLQVSTRNQGAGRGNVYSQAVSFPICAEIVRTASGFAVSSSPDGAVWTPLAAPAISMPATAIASIGATSTGSGTASVSFTNVSVNNVAEVSTTVSASVPGTYTVVAVDGAGNAATALAGITGTPGAPSTGRAMRYRPGDYANVANQKRIDLSANYQPFLDFIQVTCSNPNLVGYQVVSYWKGFEGDVQGDFAAGDAALKLILDKAAGCHKTVMISSQPLLFNCWGPGQENQTIPQYVLTQFGYTYLTGPAPQICGGTIRGFTARFWQAGTRAAYVNMLKHLVAVCDAHIACEMVTAIGETSINVDNGVDGFSVDALKTTYKDFATQMRSVSERVQLRIGTNDLWPDSFANELFDFMRSKIVLPGGPDQRLDSITQTDRVQVGYDEYRQVTFTDRRCFTPPTNDANCLPHTNEIQDPELDLFPPTSLNTLMNSGYTATNWRVKNPVTQAYDGALFAMPSMRGIYNIWTNAEYRQYKWTTHVLPLINSTSGATFWGANPVANTPCFAIYVNGCDRTLP
jgi:hypothetical protein